MNRGILCFSSTRKSLDVAGILHLVNRGVFCRICGGLAKNANTSLTKLPKIWDYIKLSFNTLVEGSHVIFLLNDVQKYLDESI